MLEGLVGDVSLTWAAGKRQRGLAGSKHPRVNIPWEVTVWVSKEITGKTPEVWGSL